MKSLILAVLAGAVAIVILRSNKTVRPPHIVFILADDLGWNDIGWNNPEVKTPVLDELARGGVLMNNTYSQPICTPTRAALMTGYYPFRTGLQHSILWRFQKSGLPLHFKILPQKLKDVGYLTHLVGKWHLGYSKWDLTPTKRGFDSFYGHLGGMTSSYEKKSKDMLVKETSSGYDLRDNTGVVQNDGTFSTMLYTKRAVDIISNHYRDYPLFLYFSMDQPAKGFEVPAKYEALHEHIRNENLRKYYGKLSVMDEAVSNITKALKSRGLWEDTILFFISDNGALVVTQGNNLPFRSVAGTLFEGGSRVPAMIHGERLKRKGYVNNGLNHITDWHTTLLAVAGIQPEPDLDGKNIWDMIQDGSPSPRNEFIYNIDNFEQSPGAAIRVGDWKLIVGNPNMLYPGQFLHDVDDWYPIDRDVFIPQGARNMETPPPPANVTYLFNLKDDPEERYDLADKYPEKVEELRKRLREYKKNAVPHVDLTLDPRANPDNFNGVFSPWL
ncbi:arylsulfatase B-like [Glandiceps talaboti]